jgi:hypothetical protein
MELRDGRVLNMILRMTDRIIHLDYVTFTTTARVDTPGTSAVVEPSKQLEHNHRYSYPHRVTNFSSRFLVHSDKQLSMCVKPHHNLQRAVNITQAYETAFIL